jgi:hypothetical protein
MQSDNGHYAQGKDQNQGDLGRFSPDIAQRDGQNIHISLSGAAAPDTSQLVGCPGVDRAPGFAVIVQHPASLRKIW